jgi:hypothetical protein
MIPAKTKTKLNVLEISLEGYRAALTRAFKAHCKDNIDEFIDLCSRRILFLPMTLDDVIEGVKNDIIFHLEPEADLPDTFLVVDENGDSVLINGSQWIVFLKRGLERLTSDEKDYSIFTRF